MENKLGNQMCLEARNEIRSRLGELEMLMQLAEECSELAQKAMKVARAEKYIDNPTPVKPADARMQLMEEAKDVQICLMLMGLNEDVSDDPKWLRWLERLDEGEKISASRLKERINREMMGRGVTMPDDCMSVEEIMEIIDEEVKG